ncbi:MAG: FecR domain-containing protein [Candidatus Rokubacteria bacterium]|nr:FecR domain-containing protein [Candidatus Rokubacteria bacterium]
MTSPAGRAVLLATLLLGVPLHPAWAQGVGVVTTLSGQATVARPVLPAPVPLKFRDDVFTRDRISTAENALLRVLLGGKALVTVRELSVLTVTEELGRSTVDLDSGKLAFGLVRQRVRPGEAFEIRTPNAVAAVRGTVVVAEVFRRSSQAAPALAVVQSDLSVLSGFVDVLLRGIAGALPVRVGAMETLSIIGNTFGQVRPLTPDAAARLMTNLRPRPQHTATPDPARRALTGQQQGQATMDAGVVELRGDRVGERQILGGSESLQKQVPLIPQVQPRGPSCSGPYC